MKNQTKTTTGGKLAVGYCRVSTTTQAEDGVSLADQRERITAWCVANGYTLLHIHADEGLSGTRASNRPGLQAALKAVCKAKGVLVVTKLDRLTRSVMDAQTIPDTIRKCGADLAIMDMGVDTSTAMGQLFYSINAATAKLYRDQISENTRAALQHKRRRGERVGGVPYGFDVGGDGVQLVPNQDEQAGLQRMRQLRASGMGYAKIATVLTGEMIPAKTADAWSAEAVRRMLARKTEPAPNA